MRRDQIRLRRGKVRLRHRTAEEAELAAVLQRGFAVFGKGDIVIAAENIVDVPRNGDRRVDHDVVGCGRGQKLQPHGEDQPAARRSDLQFARLRRDLRFLFDGRIPAEHDAPALAFQQRDRRIEAAARRGCRRARPRTAVGHIHRACLGGKRGYAKHTKNRRRGKQADESSETLHKIDLRHLYFLFSLFLIILYKPVRSPSIYFSHFRLYFSIYFAFERKKEPSCRTALFKDVVSSARCVRAAGSHR